MIRKLCIYKWLIALLLIISAGTTASAWAYPQAQQPAAWSNTPKLSSDVRPNYQFQSTSAYTPVMGGSSYSSTIYAPAANAPVYRPRKDAFDGWGEDDNPVGEVDDKVPVGEPFVLLVMAMLYLFGRYVYRSRRMIGTESGE